MGRAYIELTARQVEQILDQELNNAPPPVETGLPNTRPPTFVPPPAVADVTEAFETLWGSPFLSHSSGQKVFFNDLSDNGVWNVRIIRANDYVVFGETKFVNSGRLRLRTLGEEKAQWAGPGYPEIQAKLNALVNVADSDLMWFPERIRFEPVFDQPWAAGDYILEVIDERGQVFNVTFTQGATLPTSVVFYTAQAGFNRRVYCSYKMA